MRLIRRAILFIAVAYIAVAGWMFTSQRSMLYATADNGALAATNWTAIAGTNRFAIETADGEKLASWYVPPQAGKPVFLFFHGKGGGLERKKWRWARVRKAGYGILAFSYRGYPGSTGSPSEAGLVRDAEAVYAWLRKRHQADKIILHGLSLGTGVAIALANKVKVRAVVLEAPYTAVVDVAAERYPWLPVHLLMWDQFLSRERIETVKAPVLIVHGTKDTVIPFEHAKRLYARARDPKKFVAMPGSDHSTLVRDGIYPHIWQFLAETTTASSS